MVNVVVKKDTVVRLQVIVPFHKVVNLNMVNVPQINVVKTGEPVQMVNVVVRKDSVELLPNFVLLH